MTEAEWLNGNNPSPMLYFLMDNQPSQRKQRLFGCACCRRIWHLLTDQRSRRAIVSTERWSEGLVSPQELWPICKDAHAAEREAHAEQHRSAATAATCISADSWDVSTDTAGDEAASWAADAVGWENATAATSPSNTWGAAQAPAFAAERAEQGRLLRCIFGNPFRPVTLNPSWLTLTVQNLARSIFDERSLDRLHMLADALEEAGCDNINMLSHCRQDGEHVLGCWVVDLILGKK